MTEPRYIRNIVGQVYDFENDKWYHEDFEGKPLEYEDEVIKLLNGQDEKIKELEQELEKEQLDDITMRERYRDNLLMDPTKCIHLKEIDKVLTKDGVETSLYKCEKGNKICQESMFSPICKDYEINEEMKQ